jgi:hypoxanthine phosphoribosyltransferase
MKDKMKTIKLKNKEVKSMVTNILNLMQIDNFKPDYVVGITRGGLVPALLVSHYFNIPMNTLKVSLRDHVDTECNTWMAEDAFGYDDIPGRNILIFDDINDTGTTFNWIKQDWQSSCLPDNNKWQTIWNQNVRFAVLVNNEASNFKDIDNAAKYINKADEDSWIEFPWENWWK